jgi:enoyl-CoA hydratase/carnithine racemase
MSELLVVDQGPVRRLVFNRPEVHNAQNPLMLVALDEALRDTAADPSVRVLVLAGAGRSFCSGHDLRTIGSDSAYAANAATAEGRFRQEMRLFADPVAKFRTLSIPTVARIQGYCLAAGLMFAAAADFAIAGSDAVFGSPVLATQGVNDAEVPVFAWRIGERRAKQALWLDERIDAEEALRIGLVNWTVPNEELDKRVAQVCQKLLAMPPEALALSKASFQFMADRQGEQDFNRFHFMSHQFSHQTEEARRILHERVKQQASQLPKS